MDPPRSPPTSFVHALPVAQVRRPRHPEASRKGGSLLLSRALEALRQTAGCPDGTQGGAPDRFGRGFGIGTQAQHTRWPQTRQRPQLRPLPAEGIPQFGPTDRSAFRPLNRWCAADLKQERSKPGWSHTYVPPAYILWAQAQQPRRRRTWRLRFPGSYDPSWKRGRPEGQNPLVGCSRGPGRRPPAVRATHRPLGRRPARRARRKRTRRRPLGARAEERPSARPGHRGRPRHPSR